MILKIIHHVAMAILFFLLVAPFFTGCFPERVPTDPDYEAQDVRRPNISHHVPLSDATGVSRSTDITLWFNELMDEVSVKDNFNIWPSARVDSVQVIALDPINPNIIYAAKPKEGIFKSEDGAELWQWITRGSMKIPITELVVCHGNSDALYAATTDSGIYKSLDGGSNWQQVNTGLPEEMNVTAIAVDPSNDDVIYASTSSNGIYKSEDGGLSWTAINDGVRTNRPPQYIVINPLDSNTLYAATAGYYVLKSIDGGTSWIRLTTGFTTRNFNVLAIHPQDTALVFAGSSGGGMYVTEDGGDNWTMINTGLTNLVIQSIALNSQDTNKVIISTAGGIFKSLDKGENWISIEDIPSEVVVSMLAIDPITPERIFAATTAGIYRSEDLGDSWEKKSNLKLDDLYVTGLFDFDIWQDSTIIITPIDSVTNDTTIIIPYIYERALAVWYWDSTGVPPVDPNPEATKVVFSPTQILLPNWKYQVRLTGTFESDKETPQDSLFVRFGARDIMGNSFETDRNFTFITGED